MHRVNNVSNKIPPRKFPKWQYRKLNRHFGAVIIGIIIIIILSGLTGAGIILKTSVNNRPVHYRVKYVKIYHRSKSIRHHKRYVKIMPKRGEKLLGHWLIKLHYPTVKSREILSSYQKHTPQRDVKISQQLEQLAQSKTSVVNQRSRIRRFINHQFK